VTEQHTLAAVVGVEMGVPTPQEACFDKRGYRDIGQFGGQFLGAVDEHVMGIPGTGNYRH
jgi:hypothetical protein